MIQFILLVAAITSALLGLVVIANNTSKAINRSYLFLAFSASFWLTANALVLEGPFMVSNPDAYLLMGRLITPTFVATSYFIMLFIAYFIRYPLQKNIGKFVLLALPGLLIILLSFTELNVSLGPDGVLVLGPLLVPYAMTTLGYIAVAIYLLFWGRKNAGSQLYAAQVKYIRTSFLLSVLPGSVIGVILPLFTDSPLINLAPLFSVVFLAYTTMLIVRHHLFDIRFFVVRVLAYGTSLLLLSVVYLLPAIFVLSSVLNIPLTANTYWVIMVIAPLVVFGYGSLRNLLDRITSKVFFRSSYDPQQFIGELNGIVVSNFEVRKLLTDVSNVIIRNLKSSYCFFALNDPQTHRTRIVGVGERSFDIEDLEEITENMVPHSSRVFVAEYMPEEQAHLRRLLTKRDIAVLASLRPGDRDQNPMGYILLGPKKSGQQYNRQDVRTLEIAIDGLIVATQNALSVQEVKDINTHLQQRINDATEELRTKNAQLRHLDATKDEFLSIASHQLRTPLTSVKGYISMILEGDVGKVTDMQKHLLSEAFASSERMVHLIHDFLNVSRLQTGKFIIEQHPYDLVKLVKEEVDSLRRTAEARKMKLKFISKLDGLILNIDENKIRQVIMNFIDNALYYSHEGTTITIDLAATDKLVELKVNDTGIGVPKSEQAQLFSKFYRATNARKQRPDGTGVGLFLAKKVVSGHGGDVLFASTEGKGSTFGFTLPLAKLQVSELEKNADQLKE
jgi:signal transduction histidine kinase